MKFAVFKEKVRKCLFRTGAAFGILRPLRELAIRIKGRDRRPEKALFFRELIPAGSLVFDVGANRGQSSEIFIMAGFRVVAFEPLKELHKQILQICGPGADIKVLPFGLGAKVEHRTLYVSGYDQVTSLREDWESFHAGKTEVPVTTLDEQIRIHGMPYYCKVDVEGWELEVLRGLTHPIPCISFEFHSGGQGEREAKDVLGELARVGSYVCNVKHPHDPRMLLSEWLPAGVLAKSFPDCPGMGNLPRYGDIFCRLVV